MQAYGLALEVIIFVLLQWCSVLWHSTTVAAKEKTTKTTKATKAPRTTKGFYDILKNEKAKSLHFEYYPNYGFEPYWADGEWVLSTTRDPNVSAFESTTRKPEVCGEECHYLFRRIQHVCARYSDEASQDPSGCGTVVSDWLAAMMCTGKPGDNYDHAYKTFNTYCEFLNAQCRAKFHEPKRWVLMNIGKCKPLETYFKPLWSGDQPVSRMQYFLSSLGTLPQSHNRRRAEPDLDY